MTSERGSIRTQCSLGRRFRHGSYSRAFASIRGFRCIEAALLSLVIALLDGNGAGAANLVSIPALGVNLAPGFRISVFAGPEMANDIYAMTLDASANVVVTSEGYVKKLLD